MCHIFTTLAEYNTRTYEEPTYIHNQPASFRNARSQFALINVNIGEAGVQGRVGTGDDGTTTV